MLEQGNEKSTGIIVHVIQTFGHSKLAGDEIFIFNIAIILDFHSTLRRQMTDFQTGQFLAVHHLSRLLRQLGQLSPMMTVRHALQVL